MNIGHDNSKLETMRDYRTADNMDAATKEEALRAAVEQAMAVEAAMAAVPEETKAKIPPELVEEIERQVDESILKIMAQRTITIAPGTTDAELEAFKDMWRKDMHTMAPSPFVDTAMNIAANYDPATNDISIWKGMTKRPAPDFSTPLDTILQNIKAEKADLYTLTVDNSVSDHKVSQIAEQLSNLFSAKDITAPLVVVRDTTRLAGQEYFEFSVALLLLQAGYRVQRENWDGYLFMMDNVIYHSNDKPGKAWVPTNKALCALNWKVVR